MTEDTMSIRLDLKTIPEVAVLPIDHRVRIERRSLFLAATDWWTIPAAIVGCCLPLVGYGLPEDLSEPLHWVVSISTLVVGIGFFLLVLFARANHHARRIGRLATSLVPQSNPVVLPETLTPARKFESLAGWRKVGSLIGLGAGISLIASGASTPDWYILAAGILSLVVGGIVGSSWTLCRICQNVHVGLWLRSDRCASCGTSFHEEVHPG